MPSGKRQVAQILSRLKQSDSKKILSSIEHKNSKLADEIREMMFTFEDLTALSKKEMLTVHPKIDKNDLLLALKGASEELKEKLLCGMSGNRRKRFVEELQFLGTVKRKDVEEAQQRIADVVRQMIENGEISLDEEWIE